ncbi:MAG TPA: 2-dehydro-3-deoxygalactonokinase [Chitinophagaceae bacterium]|jgi:2-dehydro-3-deoxygalactonokinase|nr:2-dehydro-3-deoxygalactonokinase [Chitinophagaceae bacterium]
MDTFISCDWGTSTFRLRLVNAIKKEIYCEVTSEEGIAETYQQWLATGSPEAERINFYRRKLSVSISQLSGAIDKDMPVILSGMASSSIGLTELPYQEFPFTWDYSRLAVKKIDGDEKFSHTLYLLSGFRTDDDVMRGEESLLLGCDVADEDEKIFIFPGTHSKHVFVKNKTGLGFKTYMTGEIFGLLVEKSILHNSVIKGIDEKSFTEGFKAGLEGNILHHVFMVRTRQLLHQANLISNYQFLSGLLIGTELKDLKGKDCPVYLVCGEHLKQLYMTGLKLLDANNKVSYLNADDMLIKGHCKIADHYL